MTRKDKIAVLGFGSQGRAMALNLRDSGYRVTVGLRRKSKSLSQVRKEKLTLADPDRAAAEARLIIVALPDHIQGKVLNPGFFKKMTGTPTMVFLHGAAIHFNLVQPPEKLPVLLLAPHAPGLAVRDNFIKKVPYSAFYAVYRGNRKRSFALLKKLARGIGIPPTHLVRTTFAREAIGDIFGEQAVLCGGLARLLKLGFETLVESGLPPQNAYLEVAYQVDLIVALIKKYGLAGMLDRISPLARYGAVINGPRVIDGRVKNNMKRLLREIESSRFMDAASKAGVKFGRDQLKDVTSKAFDRQARRFGGR